MVGLIGGSGLASALSGCWDPVFVGIATIHSITSVTITTAISITISSTINITRTSRITIVPMLTIPI